MGWEQLDAMVGKYGSLVFRRCLKMLGNHEDAEDAAQEVFIKAGRGLGAFRGGSSVGTWLFRVATNHCLNVLKQRAGENRRREGLAAQPPARPWFDADQVLLFCSVLGSVDAETAEIGFYHHLDGMTQEEIAAATSLSRKTVGKKLKVFEETCRRVLADEPR
jgi:RNA polymerase sigma-70 factor (ECF subfamily)